MLRVTPKEIGIEYIQKEMRKKLIHCTKTKQTQQQQQKHTKENSNSTVTSHLLIGRYFKFKWIKLPYQEPEGKMLKPHDPIIFSWQKTHLRSKDTIRLKMKWWKMIFFTRRNQKKAGVTTLISDKIDFKSTKFTKHREGCYMLIKVPYSNKI